MGVWRVWRIDKQYSSVSVECVVMVVVDVDFYRLISIGPIFSEVSGAKA
jgi:hypothetical protein